MWKIWFYSGLKERTNKEILKQKLPDQTWVNPILFFKGEKIAFLKKILNEAIFY